MNIHKNLAFSCLIASSVHAISIHNYSALPILIEKITLNMNTGLNNQPAIQEKKIILNPNQTIDHITLSGTNNTILREVTLRTNNIIYLFNISPEYPEGSITIDKKGHMRTSDGITLINQESAVAPEKHIPTGPRII